MIGWTIGSAIAKSVSYASAKETDGSKQLALDEYVALCQAQAEQRGFFAQLLADLGDGLNWWGDLLGFDGSLGVHRRQQSGDLSIDNALEVWSEEIIVPGKRILGEGPWHMARAGWDAADAATAVVDYALNAVRGMPRDPGGTIARVTTDFGRMSYALANANPAAVVNGVTTGISDAYARDGLVGVTNQIFYYAGHASLAFVGGPEALGARGLSADDIALMSLRPVRVFEEHSFSIIDWTGYPSYLPRPGWPVTIRRSGSPELVAAQRSKAVINDELRMAFGLRGVQMDIHEIHPVKLAQQT